MAVCIRPEDVTPRPGGPQATSGLQDEFIVSGTHKEAVFRGTQRVALIRQTYEPGGKHFPHEHESSEQIYYLVEGKARVRIGDETFEVGPGTVFYIPPNTDHELINIGDGPLVNLLIGVELGKPREARDA